MNSYKILKEYENNLELLEDILGNESTTDIELLKIGTLLFIDRFVGVFPSDKMKRLKNNQMCIINTDDSKHSGTHWLACYRYKNKTWVYDSFDRDVKGFSKFFKMKYNWISANTHREQSYNENNCGVRSLAWLIAFDKYKTKIINII